jgi:hypothetical protein
MLGRTIEATAPVSRWAWMWLVAAAVLVAWAVAEQIPHPAIAAVLPALLAVGLWFGRPRAMVVTVDESGLVPLGAAAPIRYDMIKMIAVGGSEFSVGLEELPSRPIEIHHGNDVLVLPPRVNVAPIEFARYVHARIPPPSERAVPAKLADHATEQRAKFGIDKVEIIRVRDLLKEHWQRRRNRSVVITLAVTGILWIVLAVAIGPFARRGEDYATWIALGCICFVGAWFVGFALNRSVTTSQRLAAKDPNACIVISPAGFAMSQTGLEGVLPWSQVRDASTKIPQFLRTRRVNGVRLAIDGGEIVVLDIYDRSPYEIERLVRERLDRPKN